MCLEWFVISVFNLVLMLTLGTEVMDSLYLQQALQLPDCTEIMHPQTYGIDFYREPWSINLQISLYLFMSCQKSHDERRTDIVFLSSVKLFLCKDFSCVQNEVGFVSYWNLPEGNQMLQKRMSDLYILNVKLSRFCEIFLCL